jgi:hypothetical protein
MLDSNTAALRDYMAADRGYDPRLDSNRTECAGCGDNHWIEDLQEVTTWNPQTRQFESQLLCKSKCYTPEDEQGADAGL